jgi:hypothetical protein
MYMKCPKWREKKRQWLDEILSGQPKHLSTSNVQLKHRFQNPALFLSSDDRNGQRHSDGPLQRPTHSLDTTELYYPRQFPWTAEESTCIARRAYIPAETRNSCLQCTETEIYSPYHCLQCQLDNSMPYLLNFNIVTSFVAVFWRTIY